jgi:HTH-type transcriptional regulator/antitoxin HigA
MAKKMIRPLHYEADYDAALKEIERYFENEPQLGTPEADRFDLLALIIEDYERKHWPIEPPDAVDAIRYRMETGGYSQADLGHLLGSRQRASDILTRKRPLTMKNGMESAPRMGHSGRSAHRATTNAHRTICGVKRSTDEAPISIRAR